MENKINKTLKTAVVKILRQLVRILIRSGISYQTFDELAKWTFVDVARRDFGLSYKKNTQSRISTITGLRRQEIKKLCSMPAPQESEEILEYNRAARIIAAWVREPHFCDGEGAPLELPLEQGSPSFRELVKLFSGDLHPRTLLDELARVGAVALTERDTVKLLVRAYVPENCQEEKIDILGTDTAQLIATIDHNLQHSGKESFFQLKVSSDSLSPKVIPKLKKLSRDKAITLLQDLDHWMHTHGEENKKAGEKGNVTAGIGVYYFEEETRS